MSRRAFLAGLCAAVALPAAAEHFAQPLFLAPRFTLDWSPSRGSVILVFFAGCVSTSMRYTGHDLRADATSGLLRIDGGFHFIAPGRIATADCMNRRRAEITLREVPSGTYRIVQNGHPWSEISLGETSITRQFDPRLANAIRPPHLYWPPKSGRVSPGHP